MPKPSSPNIPTWDPAKLLQIHNPETNTWSCMGKTQSGRRCRRLLSQSKRDAIHLLLTKLSPHPPKDPALDEEYLESLIHCCFCYDHDTVETAEGVMVQCEKDLTKARALAAEDETFASTSTASSPPPQSSPGPGPGRRFNLPSRPAIKISPATTGKLENEDKPSPLIKTSLSPTTKSSTGTQPDEPKPKPEAHSPTNIHAPGLATSKPRSPTSPIQTKPQPSPSPITIKQEPAQTEFDRTAINTNNNTSPSKNDDKHSGNEPIAKTQPDNDEDHNNSEDSEDGYESDEEEEDDEIENQPNPDTDTHKLKAQSSSRIPKLEDDDSDFSSIKEESGLLESCLGNLSIDDRGEDGDEEEDDSDE